MRNVIRHENKWPWGTDITLVFTDGKGMIGVSKEPMYDFCFIHDLIVHPSVRGKGRGRRLLELAEKEVAELGRKKVVLRVGPGTWTEAWYKRCGYKDFPGGCIRDGYNDLIKEL